MSITILGISAFYHDSAAALIRDGEIIAAAQEERFTRKRHDAAFPARSIEYCLAQAGVRVADLSAIVFYDKPFLKFERLLETYLGYAPRGLLSFVTAMPIWLKEKLYLRRLLEKEFTKIGGCRAEELPEMLFSEHHQSHAASAFFPSPFNRAAVLCLDGVGEWATTSTWLGDGEKLTPLWEIQFPHSLGLLYSAFTYYAGFRVNSGEYKLMGLAPYGEPKYVQMIYDNLIDVKDDGTFRLNMDFFGYATRLKMTNARFNHLFGGPPRKPESTLTQKEMDLARSIQVVTEEVVLRLARTLHKETGAENLCLAGGVALNCVANGRMLREGPFKDIWIQPAAGDAGGALGAAYVVWHEHLGKPRVTGTQDLMKGSFLGPEYSGVEIRRYLDSVGAQYEMISDSKKYADRVAESLAQEKVVGWFQGRMEFGPRSLGSRSILGDARNPEMQSKMNLKIKKRESFRPFAPAILAESVSDYFELDRPSPYMLLVAPVKKARRTVPSPGLKSLFGIDLLKINRSEIPAVTHVDYSARVQTVHKETHPRFYELLMAFNGKTGCPVLVNTSFNVRGEPIVCTPEDAFHCFMHTEMDYLAIGDFILKKEDQAKDVGRNLKRSAVQLD